MDESNVYGLIAIALVVMLFFMNFAYTTSSIEDIELETESSYIIYTDDSTIYALNGHTGVIDFSGINTTEVWEDVRDNGLTSGRTWKERVVWKGNFTVDTSLLIGSYTIFELDGLIQAEDNTSTPILKNLNHGESVNTHIDIIGGIYDLRKNFQTPVNINVPTIWFYKIENFSIQNTIVYGGKTTVVFTTYEPMGDGICVWDGSYGYITNNHVYDSDYDGIKIQLSGSHDVVIAENVLVDNGASGIQITGTQGGGSPSAIRQQCIISDNFIETDRVVGPYAGFTRGIVLHNSLENMVQGNTIYNVDYGVMFVDYAYANIIDGNKINKVKRGVIAYKSHTSLQIINQITNNYITDFSEYGIQLIDKSDQCLIQNNYVNYGGTGAKGVALENADLNTVKNNRFRVVPNPVTVTGSSSNNVIRYNYGFTTENWGVENNLANGDVFAHGLAGTPDYVLLTLLESVYDGHGIVLSWDQPNTDATNISIDLYWCNGTAISDNVIDISWSAIFVP